MNKKAFHFIGLSLVLPLLLMSNLWAQSTSTTEYEILDSISGQPIAFATISSIDQSFITASNHKGAFFIDYGANSSMKFKISFVGYKTKIIELKKDLPQTIKLSTYTMVLDEVAVVSSEPTEEEKAQAHAIVEKALKQLKKKASGYYARADYKHRIIENGHYVKLTDGVAEITDKKGLILNRKRHFSPEEQVNYLQKRNSLNYGKRDLIFFDNSYSVYSDKFTFLLKNGLKYNPGKPDEYIFSIKERKEKEDSLFITITADKLTEENDHFFGYYAKVQEITYDIVHLKSSDEHFITAYTLNILSKRDKGQLIHEENSYFRITLKQEDDNVFPLAVDHLIYQITTIGDDIHKLEASQRLNYTEWSSKTKSKFEQTEKGQIYNQKYWAKRSLNEKETNDLGKIIDLEKQFEAQSKEKEFMALQGKVAVKNIGNLIQRYQGEKALYLVFWDNWDQLGSTNETYVYGKNRSSEKVFQGYYLAANQVIPIKEIQPIFIYTGNYIQSKWLFDIWGSDLSYHPNFYLPNEYKKLINKGESSPLFVLIDKNGDVKTVSKERIDFNIGQ